MADEKFRKEENLEGTIVFRVPFPKKLDEAGLKMLKSMTAIVKRQPYHVEYLLSYGQDSPFFAGLTNKVMLGSRDPETGYTYATPRGADMYTGNETDWMQLPNEGKVHAFTVCHFGSEEFLPECPFVLALIEFPGVNTLFLTRLRGFDPEKPSMDWIGAKEKAKFRRISKLTPTDVWFEPA